MVFSVHNSFTKQREGEGVFVCFVAKEPFFFGLFFVRSHTTSYCCFLSHLTPCPGLFVSHNYLPRTTTAPSSHLINVNALVCDQLDTVYTEWQISCRRIHYFSCSPVTYNLFRMFFCELAQLFPLANSPLQSGGLFVCVLRGRFAVLHLVQGFFCCLFYVSVI